jgi:hypothetical protein
MLVAGDVLFAAGSPDAVDKKDPHAAFLGRRGGRLIAMSTIDGKRLAGHPLDAPPVLDGLAAAHGRLYVSTADGAVLCFASTGKP